MLPQCAADLISLTRDSGTPRGRCPRTPPTGVAGREAREKPSLIHRLTKSSGALEGVRPHGTMFPQSERLVIDDGDVPARNTRSAWMTVLDEFENRREYWAVGPPGSGVMLRDRVGMHELALLLREPGRPRHDSIAGGCTRNHGVKGPVILHRCRSYWSKATGLLPPAPAYRVVRQLEDQEKS